MKKVVLLLLFVPLLCCFSCEDKEENEISPLIFNLAWDEGSTPFVMDENGYLHMNIDITRWQTIKTIYGYVFRDDSPVNIIKFAWASSHYWYTGDTLGYLVDVGLNEQFEYVYYDTTYIVGFNGFEVPCVNGSSYSREDGMVNTVIAPVRTMRGDTMTIYWGMHDNWTYEDTYGEFQIILD